MNRMEANHVYRWHGKEGLRGLRRFSLSAPSARENATLSVGLEALPAFRQQLAEEGRELPDHVQREFEDYLKCGRLEHGFLRVRCETCHEERLVAFSCKRRGLLRASCPAPFGPAYGGSKSLPAILSARVVTRAAWPRALPC